MVLLFNLIYSFNYLLHVLRTLHNSFKYECQTFWFVSEPMMTRTSQAAGLGGAVGCAVRLETRRSRVQPPPRSATLFRGD